MVEIERLFFAAVAAEFGLFASHLKGRVSRQFGCKVRMGQFAGRPAAAVQIGLGNKRAYKNARAALEHFRPRSALLIGFSGGLDPSLTPGDLVLGESVLHLENPRDPIATARMIESNPSPSSIPLHPLTALPGLSGALLTVPTLLTSADDKRFLFEILRTAAADMESAAVAQACFEHQIPLSVVRSISDTADEELDPELLGLLQPTGELSLRGLLGRLLARPSCVPSLLKLGKNSRLAAKTLDETLARLAASG